MENAPMYAGGGSTEIGLGIHPRRRWDVWVGLSGGMPYDGVGLGFEVDYRLLTHWALASRVRLGHSGGEPQHGWGLGLTYASRPPVEPPRLQQSEEDDGDFGWGGRRRAPKSPAPPTTEGPAREEKLPELAHEKEPPRFGEFQYVDSLPRLLTSAAPVYPDSARLSGTEGTVLVAALVGQDGRVRDVRIMKSIPLLDAAAVACVEEWTFRPAVLNGKVVSYWMVAPVAFPPE